MAAIVSRVEIDRRSSDVFEYVTDPARFHEWQSSLIAGRMDREPVDVGARCITTRRIGGMARKITSEITYYDPPRRWADHGIDGPIRGIVEVTVEPLDADRRSRVTISLDFAGRGIGRALIPLVVRRRAALEMPENMLALKRQLESC